MRSLNEILRRNGTACLLVLILLVIAAAGCRQVPRVSKGRFLVPSGSEGAFVITIDKDGGVSPDDTGSTYLDFVISEIGLLQTNVELDRLAGLPEFYYDDGVGGRVRLEYLTNRPLQSGESLRSLDALTEDERNNRVFVMNYEKGVLNSNSRPVKYYSFIICKPKDLNLIASRNLNEKLAEVQRNMR